LILAAAVAVAAAAAAVVADDGWQELRKRSWTWASVSGSEYHLCALPVVDLLHEV
jgi:hypothetical protein